ncbi:hypothetical protein FACS1894202_13640 [Clostridia bacterium]|nr:hypothetical protein FACS1894202_13640 [Clostridia bacterium]
MSEKGVSGFKVSSEKRDAIQLIKADAEKQKFDILLVYMFDRLGRRDDETPFVVQWFANKGIQVWSVNEGEARFDNHVDKLMNYIRFWQASGESVKTSTRTKTRLAQLTEEGIFTGGACPFGYELYDNGRVNKRGNPVKDLRICDGEAETVRMIFSKTVDEGYGSYRLSRYMNSLKIRTKSGGEWLPQAVMGILTRELYIGYLTNGDSRSPHLPSLQIISDAIFQQAQSIVAQRRANNTISRHVPITTRGQTLLSGLLYCGTCGARLTVSTKCTEGNRILRYVCYQRCRKVDTCKGQTAYIVSRVDSSVTEMLHQLFDRIRNVPLEQAVKSKQHSTDTKMEARQLQFRVG